MNMGMRISLQNPDFRSFGSKEVGLLDHMVVFWLLFCFVHVCVYVCSSFKEIPFCFSQWLHHFAFLPTVYKGSGFPTSSLNLLSF